MSRVCTSRTHNNRYVRITTHKLEGNFAFALRPILSANDHAHWHLKVPFQGRVHFLFQRGDIRIIDDCDVGQIPDGFNTALDGVMVSAIKISFSPGILCALAPKVIRREDIDVTKSITK